MTTITNELIDELKRKGQEFDSAKVKIAFIGLSGQGKSSLINAIIGERVAKTDIVEATTDATEYHHGGLTLVDLPGCGTIKHPQASYIADK